MKEQIMKLLTVKDMNGKTDKFKAMSAVIPLMQECEEQEKAKKFDVPDDAWLSIPHEMRAAMLMAIGAMYLQAINAG